MASIGDKTKMRTKILPVILAFVFLSSLAAQTTGKDQQFQPTVGQPGKDVIWVPTPEELIKVMLDMAHVTPADYVIDLGSGDGRIAIAAAKRGACALGIEYNPDMVNLSLQNAAKEGVSDKAKFIQADIFESNFSQATVVTMYLLPNLNMKLRPKILDMKPGTRIVSHAFNMEDWEPDQTEYADSRTAYLWIVPAKVDGGWTWHSSKGIAELTLHQNFQRIEGSLKIGLQEMPLKDAKLEGDRISFEADESRTARHLYLGKVDGDVIQGTVNEGSGAGTKWTATRRNVSVIR
jgi:precorrin-6B methylase 2